MRTLSAELLAAQRAVANTPHLEVELTSRDIATSLTYKTDDATNRILRIRTAEGFFGGSLFEIAAPNGDIVPIAAQIILRNSDNEFTSKDLRGFKTEIKWGFESYWNGSSTVSIAGTKTSQGEPYWVFSQKDHSLEGELITELQCISAWYYLALENIMGPGFGDTYVASGHTIRGLLFDVLTDHAIKVFTFDSSGSSFTDITSAVEDERTTSSIPVDTSDILYIGAADTDITEFDRITIYGTTDGVYAGTSVWEYWNGAAWTTLTVTDETSKLTDFDVGVADSVPKVAHFDLPADMAAVAINGSTLRWLRLRFTGAETTKPVINRIGVHRFWGLSNTAIDAIENDTDVKPDFEVSFDTSRLEILRILLDQTKSKFIMQENFFKMEVFDESPSSTDYDYSIAGTHTVFADARERVALIPNEVIVTNIQNKGPADFTQITNNSIDTAEQARWGPIIEIENVVDVSTPTLAAIRALTRIERYQAQRYQGEFSAPINIGLEPWDWVGVTDSRLSITTTGRVGRVLREYNQASSIYRDVVTLGTPKWTASLSLNRALNQYKGLPPEVFAGTSPDLPVSGELTPFFQAIKSGFPSIQPSTVDPSRGFDIDAGPFDLGIPYAGDGYAPRKYNRNPEAQGFRAKEFTVDVLSLRDFEKNDTPNALVYLDSGNSALVLGDRSFFRLHLKTTLVAHGMTSLAPTNVWAYMEEVTAAQGGAHFTGLTERTTALGMSLSAFAADGITVITKTAFPYMSFRAAKKSGTSIGDIDAGEIAFGFNNNGVYYNYILDDGSFLFLETGAGNNYVGLKAPAVVTADVIYSLPPADGSSGDVLRTDGSGVLTWVTVAAGSGAWTRSAPDVFLANSSDSVGLGIATPDTNLHVWNGSAGTVAAPSLAVVTIEDDTEAWISFLAADHSGIYFGDEADNNIGQIYYQHSDNSLHILTDTAEAIVIDNSQNVGIRTAVPLADLHVTGHVIFQRNGSVDFDITGSTTGDTEIHLGDTDEAEELTLGYSNSAEVGYLYHRTTQLLAFESDQVRWFEPCNFSSNETYGFRESTSDPTLASLLNAEFRIGRVGTGNNDGRLWIESAGHVYTFHSDNEYT